MEQALAVLLLLLHLVGGTPAGTSSGSASPCTVADGAVNAASCGGGWKLADSTAALRAALNANASLVTVPRMPGPWILSLGDEEGMLHESALPMQGLSDMTIVLATGVELQAKRGDFHSPALDRDGKQYKGWRTLITMTACRNITILGYGAKLTMWKVDYANASLYNHSEFRGAILVADSQQVSFLGLNISSTGGDAICLSRVEDTFIKDCGLDDAYRNALSMTGGINVTVEDTSLTGTGGTWPMCGMDLEPDYAYEKVERIVFRRVSSIGNQACGFSISPGQLATQPNVMGIQFIDCIASRNAMSAYTFQGMHSANITGTIDIIGGRVSDQKSAGLTFFDKNSAGVQVRVSRLAIVDVSLLGPDAPPFGSEGYWLNAPIVFQSYPNPPTFDHPWGFFPFGGVSFKDVEISYSRNQSAVGKAAVSRWPWLRAFHIDRRGKPSPGEANITGSVTLYSSTPDAVCEPSFAPRDPRVNVSIVTQCNPFGFSE
jgi:hypothetical protein